jgi:hypothetical protein
MERISCCEEQHDVKEQNGLHPYACRWSSRWAPHGQGEQHGSSTTAPSACTACAWLTRAGDSGVSRLTTTMSSPTHQEDSHLWVIPLCCCMYTGGMSSPHSSSPTHQEDSHSFVIPLCCCMCTEISRSSRCFLMTHRQCLAVRYTPRHQHRRASRLRA